MDTRPDVQAFFDPATGTVSYVVADPATGAAAVVDPVLDYDPKSGHTGTHSAQRLLDHLRAHGLQLAWILETHAHADHLSAAHWLRGQAGGRIAIGARITEVQRRFGTLFGIGAELAAGPPAFDRLLQDGDTLEIGSLLAVAIHVPGHTPADMALRIGDTVFVGDTLFMPDVGTARADFPGGDARALYRSIRRLLALPPATRLLVCHDYPPGGRAPAWETTVADQRARNIHVHDGVGEDAFVAMRQARDATLAVPALILPALQVNVRGGRLPPAGDDGVAYLKIPLNALPATNVFG